MLLSKLVTLFHQVQRLWAFIGKPILVGALDKAVEQRGTENIARVL